MQIKVDSVSDLKTNQYGPSSKIKCGNDFYYVNEDATPMVGKTLEVEVTEKTNARGGKYKVAKIVKVIDGAAPAAGGNGNGHIPWADYRLMASEAHKLAIELEPDGKTEAMDKDGCKIEAAIDRSAARAAMVNTIMIAFSNGKLVLPDDDMPF